ncbi:hypothetical protein BC827DRAFT_1155070 [Russula dissimulans]|nr:hypothetical protein BC827DRAFT_1155070 [Russula dissimulans]
MGVINDVHVIPTHELEECGDRKDTQVTPVFLPIVSEKCNFMTEVKVTVEWMIAGRRVHVKCTLCWVGVRKRGGAGSVDDEIEIEGQTQRKASESLLPVLLSPAVDLEISTVYDTLSNSFSEARDVQPNRTMGHQIGGIRFSVDHVREWHVLYLTPLKIYTTNHSIRPQRPQIFSMFSTTVTRTTEERCSRRDNRCQLSIRSVKLRVRWRRGGRVDKGTPRHAVLGIFEAKDDCTGDGRNVLLRA